MNAPADAPLGLLSFLSFAFSVIAAVLAIDMYRLLRTGEFGKTWRLLIIASVMFVMLQVLRMAEVVDIRAIDEARLSQVVELCFVMALAYAFHLQRKAFTCEHCEKEEIEESETEPDAQWESDFLDDGEEDEDNPTRRIPPDQSLPYAPPLSPETFPSAH